jgi:hypothetical protein
MMGREKRWECRMQDGGWRMEGDGWETKDGGWEMGDERCGMNQGM